MGLKIYTPPRRNGDGDVLGRGGVTGSTLSIHALTLPTDLRRLGFPLPPSPHPSIPRNVAFAHVYEEC